jgi:hypothetical protein
MGMLCDRCQRPFVEGEPISECPDAFTADGDLIVTPVCPSCVADYGPVAPPATRFTSDADATAAARVVKPSPPMAMLRPFGATSRQYHWPFVPWKTLKRYMRPRFPL